MGHRSAQPTRFTPQPLNVAARGVPAVHNPQSALHLPLPLLRMMVGGSHHRRLRISGIAPPDFFPRFRFGGGGATAGARPAVVLLPDPRQGDLVAASAPRETSVRASGVR